MLSLMTIDWLKCSQLHRIGRSCNAQGKAMINMSVIHLQRGLAELGSNILCTDSLIQLAQSTRYHFRTDRRNLSIPFVTFELFSNGNNTHSESDTFSHRLKTTSELHCDQSNYLQFRLFHQVWSWYRCDNTSFSTFSLSVNICSFFWKTCICVLQLTRVQRRSSFSGRPWTCYLIILTL